MFGGVFLKKKPITFGEKAARGLMCASVMWASVGAAFLAKKAAIAQGQGGGWALGGVKRLKPSSCHI